MVHNLGKSDRILRIVVGLVLGIIAVRVRAHSYAGGLLGLFGLVVLIEGVIGH